MRCLLADSTVTGLGLAVVSLVVTGEWVEFTLDPSHLLVQTHHLSDLAI